MNTDHIAPRPLRGLTLIPRPPAPGHLCRVRRLVILFFLRRAASLSAAARIARLPPVFRGLTTSFRKATSLISRIRSPSSQPYSLHHSCEVKVSKKDLFETTGRENHLPQPLSCLVSVSGVLPPVLHSLIRMARISALIAANCPLSRLFCRARSGSLRTSISWSYAVRSSNLRHLVVLELEYI